MIARRASLTLTARDQVNHGDHGLPERRPKGKGHRWVAVCMIVCSTVPIRGGHAQGVAPSGDSLPAGSEACAPKATSGGFPHGRLADPRIQYLTVGPYICRWALQQQDPQAASSDVVRPITYVLDTTVPAKWRPYVMRGVQDWLPVFEAIGLRHAMVVQLHPVPDAGLFVGPPAGGVVTIRMAGDGVGGTTICTADAQSGSMLGCAVTIASGIIHDAGQGDCIVSTGSDPALPLFCSDSVIGLYLERIVAHEVGHTLGLGHNWYAGQAYPTDSLRSATFVHQWGFTPSIMIHYDYDLVAQPEDHIPLRDRWLRIGPYDRWALAWAYRPIADATTPQAERPTLERWRRAQDTAIYLRSLPDSSTSESRMGGTNLLRAVDNMMRNRARLWQRLWPPSPAHNIVAAENSDGEGLDGFFVAQWRKDLLEVTDRTVGGTFVPHPPPTPLGVAPFTPIEGSRQLAGVRFVLAHALYGWDPELSLQDSLARGVRGSRRSPRQDSIPRVVDTAGSVLMPHMVVWSNAQYEVLERLVDRLPAMPAAVRPTACRYIADAVRHIQRLEGEVSPSVQGEAASLRLLFQGVLLEAHVCPDA